MVKCVRLNGKEVYAKATKLDKDTWLVEYEEAPEWFKTRIFNDKAFKNEFIIIGEDNE